MPFWSLLSSVFLSLRDKMRLMVLAGNRGVLWERHNLGEELKCLPVWWAAPSPWFCGSEDAQGTGAPAVQCMLCTSLVLPVFPVSLSLCTLSVPTAQVRKWCLELKLLKWAKSAPTPGQISSPVGWGCYSPYGSAASSTSCSQWTGDLCTYLYFSRALTKTLSPSRKIKVDDFQTRHSWV